MPRPFDSVSTVATPMYMSTALLRNRDRPRPAQATLIEICGFTCCHTNAGRGGQAGHFPRTALGELFKLAEDFGLKAGSA
jgi:hypothetical protein